MTLTVIDRARGIMTGIAVGNLFGISMEGWNRARIVGKWPQGITEIEAHSGYPDDDDLAQSIIIAEAAAEGPLCVDDLGRKFWEWAEVNGLGIGILTQDVLALYGGDDPRCLAQNRQAGMARTPRGIPIAEASKKAWRGERAGNGAIMRCAPLAIRYCRNLLRLASRDTMPLTRESVVSAIPTHWDRRCGWSCAIVNIAISGALRNRVLSAQELIGLAKEGVAAAIPELGRYGYEAAPPKSVVEAVHQSSSSRIGDLTFDGHDMGFTLLAMQAALSSYWHAPDFETGLRQIVEAGGDTDTNGAIVGAVLGARFGCSGIPSRWRRRTAEIRSGRIPMAHYADVLATEARREQHWHA